MSDYRPLEELKKLLHGSFDSRNVLHGVTFGNPRAMSQILKEIKRDLGDSEGKPSQDLIINAIKKFDIKGDIDTFVELKYVCYGIETPIDQKNFKIIEDSGSLNQLFEIVSKRSNKQLRRCFQGLLSSYFHYDPKEVANKTGKMNWVSLKTFLRLKLKPLYSSSSERGNIPEWLSTLYEHKNLLEDNPCQRYADSLGKGNTQELKEVCSGLGIESSSWVWNEAFMAYVQSVCELDDQRFQSNLNGILNLVKGEGQIQIPDRISMLAISKCVIRYAECTTTPEHAVLRDLCVRRIGNPMLDQTKWDAFVNNEPARLMIASWLKQQLIKDFFELLAQDGAADIRRLNYWLKWEQHISEMWFFLGDMAYKDRRNTFKSLRERMGGSIRKLVEPSRLENNAFVMRIGDYLVIEFSTKNNAMFLYEADVASPLMKMEARTTPYLKNLKGFKDKYTHSGYWELAFDKVLRVALRNSSKSRSAQTNTRITTISTSKESPSVTTSLNSTKSTSNLKIPIYVRTPANLTLNIDHLLLMAMKADVPVDDNRSKGGSLWVILPIKETNREFAKYLEDTGFKYKAGQGYWRK